MKDTTKYIRYSINKATEGGLGYGAIQILKDKGIKAKKDPLGSCFVGDVAILVEAKYEKKADDILFN